MLHPSSETTFYQIWCFVLSTAGIMEDSFKVLFSFVILLQHICNAFDIFIAVIVDWCSAYFCHQNSDGSVDKYCS